MLTLVEVTPQNWRRFTRLQIAQSQRGQVADNVLILARAYVFRDGAARARGICLDGEPVGLLLQREYEQGGRRYCVLDQLMIAQEAQGRGYGTAIMSQWLNEVRQEGCFDAVTLCYVGGHEQVRRFYERLGFVSSGVVDGDEVVMEFRLA